VDCTAEYFYGNCNKLNIKCPNFNLKNKKNCKKGDYLVVNGKKYCQKNGPNFTTREELILRFVSDKKGKASGAECQISCLDETQTTAKTTAAATTTHTTEDYFCGEKTSTIKITGNNSQAFIFNTNTNGLKRYKDNVDCTAEYFYGNCNKLNIKCPNFDLKNKNNCKKGDYLVVNGKKFCQKNGPNFTTEEKLLLRFVSDKKVTASGAECLISCLDETQTTAKTTAAATTTSTTTTTTTAAIETSTTTITTTTAANEASTTTTTTAAIETSTTTTTTTTTSTTTTTNTAAIETSSTTTTTTTTTAANEASTTTTTTTTTTAATSTTTTITTTANTTSTTTIDCLAGYNGWKGKCYKFIEAKYTWKDANGLCGMSSRTKARLASIHSQEENDHVESLFNYKDGLNAWIGGYINSEGDWAWIDGSAWTGYTNFAKDEPNGLAPQSIMMYGRAGVEPFKWNDEPPTMAEFNGMVCSYSP